MFIRHSTSTEKKNAYIPELKRRDNEMGNALLHLGDELIARCDQRISRLPDKHRAELYNRILPTGGTEEKSCLTLLAFDEDTPAAMPAGFTLTGYAGEAEERFVLTEAYTVSPVILRSLWLTEPERDGYCLLYDSDDGSFEERGFSKAVASPDNFSLLTFWADNLFLGTEQVSIPCDTIPGIIDNVHEFTWTLCGAAEGEDDRSITAVVEGDNLRLTTEAQTRIGAYRIRAYCPQAVRLTPGLLHQPRFEKIGSSVPDYLIVGGEVLTGEACVHEAIYPFGHPFRPREEFYIACNAAFCCREWAINIQFILFFVDSLQPYPILPTEGVDIPKPGDSFADHVSIQYYNGDTFVPFPESAQYKTIFAENQTHARIILRIPEDMSPVEVHGLTAFWVRLYLVSAEGFDYRPVTYHSPAIMDMLVDYRSASAPDRILYETLYQQRDITQAAVEGVTVFTPHFQGQGGLYMGLAGTVSGGLNLYVQNTEQKQCAITGAGCTLLTPEGDSPVAIIDRTDGWRRTGVLSIALPPKPEAVPFLSGPAQVFLRFPLASREGLDGLQDLRLNVCPAVGTGLLPKGTPLTGDFGITAVLVCEGITSQQGGDIHNPSDARFFLSTQERCTNTRDMELALRRQFAQIDCCRFVYDPASQVVDLYVHLREGNPVPFYLFDGQVARFFARHCGIAPTVVVKPFLPVKVAVRALCAPGSGTDSIGDKLCAYIEDRLLFPPGYLPSAEELLAFLQDERIAVSRFAVIYQGADDTVYSGKPEDFPYGIACNGEHIIMEHA